MDIQWIFTRTNLSLAQSWPNRPKKRCKYFTCSRVLFPVVQNRKNGYLSKVKAAMSEFDFAR
jgi:hypothetical protein